MNGPSGRRPDDSPPGPPPRIAYAARQGVDPLRAAFARREFVAPWRGCEAVAAAEVEATFARILHTPRDEPAVAYIHVPYCRNHCLFCGFFQNVWQDDVSAAFVDDVVAELARLAAYPLVASAPVEAVYIGGGTPSALAAEDLARLVEGIRRHLPLSAECEITVEGRSFEFGPAKAAAALDAGANRISIGVQSFDTAIRRRLGRKASGAEVRSFLAELIALDRAAIACDLIYGLPGQDDAIWRADVEAAATLGLDGMSVYALSVWSGGPLARAIGSGKLPPAGTLAAQAEAYAAASDLLGVRGWRRMTQSHFASTARERNRYNRMIKAGVACLPFGPGAGGSAHGHRWRNISDLERRRALLAAGRMPIDGLARTPRDHRARAAITAGMEEGALDLPAVDAVAPGFLHAAAPLIEDWAAAGLGESGGGVFRTTLAGAFWMTTMTNGLHAVLDHLRTASPTQEDPPP